MKRKIKNVEICGIDTNIWAHYNENRKTKSLESNQGGKKVQRNKKINFEQLKKVLIISIVLILTSFTVIMAAEGDENCVIPTDEQYLELRAVSVKEVAGQNKQVIMELWGNNVEFKRI